MGRATKREQFKFAVGFHTRGSVIVEAASPTEAEIMVNEMSLDVIPFVQPDCVDGDPVRARNVKTTVYSIGTVDNGQ